jgi:DNA mismatch repair protein MutH
VPALPPQRPAPQSLAELARRAAGLYGRTTEELVAPEFADACARSTHQKGSVGQVVERILGATAGSHAGPDFPELGVELKTVPVARSGAPKESTFVCSVSVTEADRQTFERSVLRQKLRHVLWVPVVVDTGPLRFGAPWLWRPTAAQEAVLHADFDELVGRLAQGEAESLSARAGRWLQLRPKAANGLARVRAYDADGQLQWAMPRGFYLRAKVTHALFRDPSTLIGAD